MSMPYPAPTDPAAAAARHIRNLAEAVEARLTAAPQAVVIFDTGNATADANGDIFTGGLSPLTSIAGAVFGPASYVGGITPPNNDILWVPTFTRRVAGNAIALRCYNAPNLATNAGRVQRGIGLAWGPTATAAQRPAEPGPAPAPRAVNPDTFPAGQTPVYHIRYPGTGEPLHTAAASIERVAGDIGAAIGGVSPTLKLITLRTTVTVGSSGYCGYSLADKLSRIRGGIVTPWDNGTFVRRSRIARVNVPEDFWSPGTHNDFRFTAYSNEKAGASNYPAFAPTGEAFAFNAIVWGDPL